MTTMVASMSCRCGNVRIEFSSSDPRVSTECCCNHCLARVQYLERLGGPTIPDNPLVNSKWDNCVKIVKGRDYLFAFKLTPETQVVNIASTCCHTFLLGRHAGYDGNCVTTSSDFPIWNNADLPFLVSSRWFSNQWDPERLAKYPKLVGIWVQSDGSIQGETGWELVFEKQLECIQRDIKQGTEGESFDEIVESLQRDKIIIVNHPS